MMQKKTKITLIVLTGVALVLGGSIWKAVSARYAKQEQAKIATAQLQKTPVYSLSADAYAVIEPVDFHQTVSISGSVQAVRFASLRSALSANVVGLLTKEGQSVKAGQVLVQLDDKEVSQKALAAQAQLDIAKRQFQNSQALAKQGFISSTALEIAQANYDTSKANAEVARQAQQDAFIKAPFDATISKVYVKLGDRVGLQSVVVDVVGKGGLEVEVPVPVAYVRDVKKGQTAWLRAEGLGQDQQAKVNRISPSVNAANRQIMVYLSLPSSTLLRHGEFAEGKLLLQNKPTVAVPVSAVQRDKPQPYIQLVQEGKVKHFAVELGATGRFGEVDYVELKGVTPSLGQVFLLAKAGPMVEGTGVQLQPVPAAPPLVESKAASTVQP